MGITAISRDWGFTPSIVRITTTDTLATVETTGYLTSQSANLEIINKGAFQWETGDSALVYASDGSGFFEVSSDFSSLLPDTAGGGSVTLINTGTGLTGGPITTSGTISFAPVPPETFLANISGGSAPPVPHNSLVTVQNLGFGDQTGVLVLTDSDFAAGGGTYILTNPPPTIVSMTPGPGRTLQLPVQNDPTSIQASQFIEIINFSPNSCNINNGVGSLIFQISAFGAYRAFPNDRTTAAGAWEFLGEVNTINANHTGDVTLASATETIYVANSGDDINGDGSVLYPFATIQTAINFASASASSSAPYEINVTTGVYSEVNLNLFPWIYIEGNNSQLTVSGSVTLDASWSGGGSMLLKNFNNLQFPATVTLDFSSLSPSSLSLIVISNNMTASNSNIIIIGDPVNGTILEIQNNFGFSGNFSYDITDCFPVVTGGACGNLSITRNSETIGNNVSVNGMSIIGNFSITSSTISGTTFFHENCKMISTSTYTETGLGFLTVLAKGNTYFSAPILDNGISGGSVNFRSDFLTALPTLLNGAIYTPTSISNAMNANYTPVNYSALDSSIYGNLAGIDNALGNDNSQSLQDTYDTGLDANINLSDGRPISINTISSSAPTNAIVTPSTGANTPANYRMGGSVFNVLSSINVTALQYLDATFTQPGTREVGIWIKSTGELLGSAIIAKTDPLDGSGLYRTKILDSAILLSTGIDYVVAATIAANETNYINTDAVPALGIILTQSASGPASSFPIPLTFPTNYIIEPNATEGGFFQFSTFISIDNVEFNDNTTNPTSLFEVLSSTRGSNPIPVMSSADYLAIPSPFTGLFAVTNDQTPNRIVMYDVSSLSYKVIAYTSDLPPFTIPSLTQGQIILGTSTNPVAGILINSDGTINIDTSINGVITLSAFVTLQNAYNNGSAINLGVGGLMSFADSALANSINFFGDSPFPLMSFVGTTNSTIPYAVLTDAQFAALPSLSLGMIGYTTTSNRLSIQGPMTIQQLAYLDDTNVSGIFTPGITNASNTSSISFLKGMYTATGTTSGKIITCTLQFSCTVTAASPTVSSVTISSLPVSPGSFSGTNQASIMGGSVYTNASPANGDGQVLDVVSNNAASTLTASFLTASNSGTKVITISFMYVIQ